jgi:metal-responsive CopG/Arc/MetJ family transcriptional regulator
MTIAENFRPQVEIITVRMPEGTLAQIDKVLIGGELRSAFLRKAVSNELVRRYREGKRS